MIAQLLQGGMALGWLQGGAEAAAGGRLGGSWGRLGGVLGRLGGVLGPLGAQDPTRARAICFSEASWDRLGLILGRFLGGFWGEISILFLPYP